MPKSGDQKVTAVLSGSRASWKYLFAIMNPKLISFEQHIKDRPFPKSIGLI